LRSVVTITIIALVGLGISGLVMYHGQKEVPFVPLAQTYPNAPYEHFIAGQGIIESAYKNISIGSSYSDVVTDIYVNVGDYVPRGGKLFKTDTRRLEAQLVQAKKARDVALQQYQNQHLQFSYYKKLFDKNAVSKQAYTNAEYAERIAYQNLELAKATVDVYITDIMRATVRAPIGGQVLELNVRIGQYINQIMTQDAPPYLLFGNTQDLHVRIDIDEEDAWRYTPCSPATGYIRGNYGIAIPLEYVYTEPYIIPKKSLTGSDIERVDTRVLQVVYRFKKAHFPVYPGQLLDVYVQARPYEGKK
jgi:HlyD family secretion protein